MSLISLVMMLQKMGCDVVLDTWDWLGLVRRVYWRNIHTEAPLHGHYCADSGSKWHRRLKMAAALCGMYWLQFFCTVRRKWRCTVLVNLWTLLLCCCLKMFGCSKVFSFDYCYLIWCYIWCQSFGLQNITRTNCTLYNFRLERRLCSGTVGQHSPRCCPVL